ncbi:MAG: flagellar hook-basal body complex protein FliE [Mariprofundaceae bacterium]
MNIQGYGPQFKPVSSPQEVSKPGNFGALVKQYTEQMNHESKAAGKAAGNLALGGEGSVSETLLAVQKADLSFQLMMSVRNKLVDAYREVMRMQA